MQIRQRLDQKVEAVAAEFVHVDVLVGCRLGRVEAKHRQQLPHSALGGGPVQHLVVVKAQVIAKPIQDSLGGHSQILSPKALEKF